MEKQLVLMTEEQLQEAVRKSIMQLKDEIKIAAYEGTKRALQEPQKGLYIGKKQACSLLGISYYSLQKLIDEGLLKTSPNGKKILSSSLESYLSQLKNF